MTKTFTPRDVELLGYSTATIACEDERGGFAVIDATGSLGLETIRVQFIYLKSKCTQDGARFAAGKVSKDAYASVYVVKPNSSRLKDDQLRNIFGVNVSIRSHEDLIWEKLGNMFTKYLESLSDVHREEHFIAPRSKDPRDFDLMSKLIDYMSGKSDLDNGELTVLSADAGVGKTTVARHLIRQLVDNAARCKTIPIYIEAEHWRKLDLGKADGLWDVIATSLREMSPNLMLAEPLFRHDLSQGYLSFVFDGFDELCSHEIFDPRIVLGELADIASESEARILLTTRTLFWEARIDDEFPNVTIWKMDAFNVQQARDYLRKCFRKHEEKKSIAQELYSQLLRESSTPRQNVGSVHAQFVNLPLCARMLADFVENDGTSLGAAESIPILQRMLASICDREITRQGLATSVENQMESFRDMAVAYHDDINPRFEVDDLFLSENGFDGKDFSKVSDHALVTQSDSEGKFRLRYDFLGPHLRAVSIGNWIRNSMGNLEPAPQDIVKIMEKEMEGKGHVLEQMAMVLDPQEDFVAVSGKCRLIRSSNERAASFLFHVAQSLVARDSDIKTAEERVHKLFAGITDQRIWSRRLSGWTFRGRVEGLDLRRVSFTDCKFISVNFKNCLAGESTVFDDCIFEGDLEFEPRTGWRQVAVRSCHMRYPTDVTWEAVLERKSGDYSKRVEEILRIGLRKFWRNGRIKKSLRINDWKKGGLSQSKEATMLFEIMLSVGLLEKVHISGVEEGGVVLDQSSVRDLQNYMDNQQKSGKVRRVHDRLLAEINK